MSRFPLLTDAHVREGLVQALRRGGWDVVRSIDVFPEKTPDEILFAHAAQQGRVFVTNDEGLEAIAISWLAEGRPFRGLVLWRQRHHRRMTIGDLVEAFEELAAAEDPFGAYPVRHITPRRS